jgi:alpha-ribazole phosphatase
MADESERAAVLWCWRHPRARGAAGRCIGHTDLPVDPRQAKRLAQRLRATARRHALPREVWVSPLARSRAVGRWLRRWGWRVHVDARLTEVDFGAWDGRAWVDIPWAEVEAWRADLLHHAPGGGEPLATLAQRAHAFAADALGSGAPRLLVGHAGWITALVHLPPGCADLRAADWPAPLPHGALRRWPA